MTPTGEDRFIGWTGEATSIIDPAARPHLPKFNDGDSVGSIGCALRRASLSSRSFVEPKKERGMDLWELVATAEAMHAKDPAGGYRACIRTDRNAIAGMVQLIQSRAIKVAVLVPGRPLPGSAIRVVIVAEEDYAASSEFQRMIMDHFFPCAYVPTVRVANKGSESQPTRGHVQPPREEVTVLGGVEALRAARAMNARRPPLVVDRAWLAPYRPQHRFKRIMPLKRSPLRGPKVFISYSFKDEELAAQLEMKLVDRGFQVWREVDGSLLGLPMSDMIRTAIRDAEVVVPLITANSLASKWVQLEVQWARERITTPGFKLIPLVALADAAHVPAIVKDFGFVRSSPAMIAPAAVLAIENTAAGMLCPIQVARNDCFSLDDAALRAAIGTAPQARGRLILDPGDALLQAFEEGINALTACGWRDISGFEQFAQGILRARELLEAMSDVMIRVIRHSLEIESSTESAAGLGSRAVNALWRFAHATAVQRLQVALEGVGAPHPWGSRATTPSIGYSEDLVAQWALAEPPEGKLTLLDFISHSKDDLTLVWLPRRCLDLPGPPRGNPIEELNIEHWVTMILPQLASRVGEQIQQSWDGSLLMQQGWHLSDYHEFGVA